MSTRKSIKCVDCKHRVDAGAMEPEDACPRYSGTSDSNGYLYCTNCGHGEHVHP